jgi:hypothetical protein
MGRAAGARDLALALGERFENFRFLIRDRGSNFIRSLGAVFQANGTGIRQAAIQAPRINATCDRLLDVLRRELLDRMLILSEAHLRAVLIEYRAHYNTARVPRSAISFGSTEGWAEKPELARVNGDGCGEPGSTASTPAAAR